MQSKSKGHPSTRLHRPHTAQGPRRGGRRGRSPHGAWTRRSGGGAWSSGGAFAGGTHDLLSRPWLLSCRTGPSRSTTRRVAHATASREGYVSSPRCSVPRGHPTSRERAAVQKGLPARASRVGYRQAAAAMSKEGPTSRAAVPPPRPERATDRGPRAGLAASPRSTKENRLTGLTPVSALAWQGISMRDRSWGAGKFAPEQSSRAHVHPRIRASRQT